MSTLLKATARLTSVGAAVSTALARIGNALHVASLNLHDSAFTAKRQALANKHAGLQKAKQDSRVRHVAHVASLYEKFRDDLAKLQERYDNDLEQANDDLEYAYHTIGKELDAVAAQIEHYRNEHNAFNPA